MKVVLLKDIKGTGKAYTAVDVKDGHALNLLIPRGLAVPATPATLKQVEVRAKQAEQERAIAAKLVEDRLAALADTKLTFTKKANEQGHLYDGVDAKEIAEAAGIPADSVRIERPFKELGTFEVPVSYGDQFGKFSIEVVAE
ncbi:MAG TPA: 50S ribosomal protein L9 [Candidatus Paceibacterota bacterium]|nr:50S ribosomal protein L9 [Candidatus Paceibacterota bacterium]